MNTTNLNKFVLSKLVDPDGGHELTMDGNYLISAKNRYRINAHGIPLFSADSTQLSSESMQQQEHYDYISKAYNENLASVQTREYMKYLDRVFADQLARFASAEILEVCCGSGELSNIDLNFSYRAIGIDISEMMLIEAMKSTNSNTFYVQGDATRLPIAGASFDAVVILGGIHHVPDRNKLFSEVSRVLKPGGVFLFREPLNEFWLWRLLRVIVYKVSPLLDIHNERPLRLRETKPFLEQNDLHLEKWIPAGLFGFCLFMNSDVLKVNTVFNKVPGIKKIVNQFSRLDEYILKFKSMSKLGLQVVGVAIKS